MKKMSKIVLIVLGVILFMCLVVLIRLFLISPGKIEPFLDESGNEVEGSIAEKDFVSINGVRQGMIIRGKSTDNPVLLFLHGGPGMPEYFMTKSYPTRLEDYFTVCYWDQRGGGLSFDSRMDGSTITEEVMLEDVEAVTNYLRERFGKDKIYLMSHSWGTFLGILAAKRTPELYYAYIGMSQTTNQKQSELMAYDKMLSDYRAEGNTGMLKKLEKYKVHESEEDFEAYMKSLRESSLCKLGYGTTRDMRSDAMGIFFPVMENRSYTVTEKINMWRGRIFMCKESSLERQKYEDSEEYDIRKRVPKLELPYYNFAGKYDYTVNIELQKEYFDEVKAPEKEFYLFEESAHSPLFEEPEKAVEIMREIAGRFQ